MRLPWKKPTLPRPWPPQPQHQQGHGCTGARQKGLRPDKRCRGRAVEAALSSTSLPPMPPPSLPPAGACNLPTWQACQCTGPWLRSQQPDRERRSLWSCQQARLVSAHANRQQSARTLRARLAACIVFRVDGQPAAQMPCFPRKDRARAPKHCSSALLLPARLCSQNSIRSRGETSCGLQSRTKNCALTLAQVTLRSGWSSYVCSSQPEVYWKSLRRASQKFGRPSLLALADETKAPGNHYPRKQLPSRKSEAPEAQVFDPYRPRILLASFQFPPLTSTRRNPSVMAALGFVSAVPQITPATPPKAGGLRTSTHNESQELKLNSSIAEARGRRPQLRHLRPLRGWELGAEDPPALGQQRRTDMANSGQQPHPGPLCDWRHPLGCSPDKAPGRLRRTAASGSLACVPAGRQDPLAHRQVSWHARASCWTKLRRRKSKLQRREGLARPQALLFILG